MCWEDLYERAKWFGGVAHCKQKYGTHDYTYHLEQVDMTLNRFGFKKDFKLKAGARLHDVIEDTKISYDQIKFGFGQEIADIVYAVTNEMGRSRRERHEKTYAKIRESKDALALKLADRIANMEFSKGTDSGFFEMYKQEWKGFHDALYNAKETDSRINKMWRYLEDLFGDDE
jgi:(p)ppGpp synthase/HD superfamily hydrolase